MPESKTDDKKNKEFVVYRITREAPDGTRTYHGSTEVWEKLHIEYRCCDRD